MLAKLKQHIHLLPLILSLFFIPLLVQVKKVNLNLVEQVAFRNEVFYYDFFSKIKSDAVLLFGLIAAIFVMVYLKKYTEQSLLKYYLFILAYVLLVLVSTYGRGYLAYISLNFSEITYNLELVKGDLVNLSVMGYPEHFEGMLVHFAYMGLFMLSIKVVRKGSDYSHLLTALMASAAVIGVIGLTQLMNVDLFQSGFGKALLQVFGSKVDLTDLAFMFTDGHIYATLYNPNYVGSYVALVIPVVIAVTFYQKNKVKLIFGVGLTALLVLNLFGSRSLTGSLGIMVAGFFGLYFLKDFLKKHIKYVVLVGVLTLIVALVFVGITDHPTTLKVRSNLAAIVQKDDAKLSSGEVINGITPVENGFFVSTEEKGLYVVKASADGFLFADENQNYLLAKVNEAGGYYFEEVRYSDTLINFYNGGAIIEVSIDEKKLVVELIEGYPFVMGQNYNLYPPVYEVPSIGFKNMQQFGTKRGYIWSKTLPLLKDHFFIGTGPGTFAVVYPNYDVLGKLNMYGATAYTVDKPHNMYLQMAVNTGVVSMVLFVLFNVFYGVGFFKTYKGLKNRGVLYGLSIGIFCGIVGYLVAGMGNDSVIGVATVYWILMGMGISLQVIAEEKEQHLDEPVVIEDKM